MAQVFEQANATYTALEDKLFQGGWQAGDGHLANQESGESGDQVR